MYTFLIGITNNGYICIKRASQVDFNFDTLMMMFTEYKISDSKIKTLVQI